MPDLIFHAIYARASGEMNSPVSIHLMIHDHKSLVMILDNSPILDASPNKNNNYKDNKEIM